MNLSQEEIDDLIAKQIAGEASPEEVAWLEGWKAVSAENKTYYEESVALFRHIDALTTEVNVNVDGAWQKLDERISTKSSAKIISLAPRKGVFRIAAAIFFLAVFSVILYSVLAEPDTAPLSLMAANKVEEKTLPDGSKVVLNKTAQIEFVSNKNKREVKLKGEAFFEVVHNNEQPFVVNVDGILIEDIGTAFNVKALPNSDMVEVLVEEGEVRFYTADARGLDLHKGQSGFYNKTTKEFRLVDAVTDVNAISYKTKNFQFRAAKLGEVIKQLTDVYGISIELENTQLAECSVSVSFENEQPELIMEIIAETLNLELIKNGQNFLLKGASCN